MLFHKLTILFFIISVIFLQVNSYAMEREDSELETLLTALSRFNTTTSTTEAEESQSSTLPPLPPDSLFSETTKEEPPAKLWDIAQYLILLEIERLSKRLPGADLDRWKLQKLCYYSQGYYLSRHKKSLFEEELTAYHYGPYNRPAAKVEI